MLLFGLALAHTPHDTTTFLAVDEDGRLLTALSRTPELLLLSSEDEGRRWDRDRWLGDIPTDGVWLDGEAFVVDGSDGISFADIYEGELWTGGEAGLFIDGEPVTDEVIVALASPCYATTDRVVCQGEHSLDAQVVDIAWGGDQTYVATDGEGLLELVGESWERVDGPGDRVACVDVLDGVLYVAEFADILWVDGVSSEPFPETQEGPGNPPDGRHYFGFEQSQEAVWLASWEGILSSDDQGQSWQEHPVITPEVHRSVAIDDQGRWYLGSYGGGLVRFDASTGISEPLSKTSPAGFVRQVEVGDTVWFTEKGQLWRFDDPDWTSIEGSAEDISVDGSTLLVAGEDGVLRSTDGEVFVQLLQGDFEHVALDGERWAALDSDGTLTLDGEVVGDGYQGVNDIALDEGVVVLSTSAGLIRTDGSVEHAGEWVEAWEDGVALLDDGHVVTDLAVVGDITLRSTHDGVFDQDGDLVSNVLLIDAGHPGWSGEAIAHTDTESIRWTRHVVSPWESLSLSFHGEGLRLHGVGTVLVDGEEVEPCALVSPGYHTLEIPGPAEVDAVEILLGRGWQDLDCGEEEEEPPSSRCGGCASLDLAGGAWLLALLLAARRDRGS
ncbi:MAG TPA: hypothetical protein QGF58_15645 [Myxococcota bacterium]|nr:hypothetical protein [Myxococcota bacterium]